MPIEAYLEQRGDLPMPRIGALAIAAAITGDRIRMTNHPWSFSVAALRDRLGFERLIAINDFTAVALALPLLSPGDRVQVGGGAPVAGKPIAVLGPGSGLGASGLVPTGSGWVALTGEGGHATMAPANERESAVLALMRQRFDHVSAERVLSGPGLVNLYNALAGARRGAGGALYRGADHRPRNRRQRPAVPRGDRRCSARCSAPSPAIWC